MPRPISPTSRALARQLTTQAEDFARLAAARLTRNELPGITHQLTKDLRAGDEVLGDLGTLIGTVSRVDQARKAHYMVVSWAEGAQWSGPDTHTHRVRRPA